jgi:hypothetical protein
MHDKRGCLWKSDVGLEAKYLYVFALYAIDYIGCQCQCSSFKVGWKNEIGSNSAVM